MRTSLAVLLLVMVAVAAFAAGAVTNAALNYSPGGMPMTSAQHVSEMAAMHGSMTSMMGTHMWPGMMGPAPQTPQPQ